MTVETSTTEGYLLISVWDIYRRGDDGWSADCEQIFMEQVQEACRKVESIITKAVDWDEVDTVFDYEFGDDVTPDSLAQVIYTAVRDEGDLDVLVPAWLKSTNLPLRKEDPSNG